MYTVNTRFFSHYIRDFRESSHNSLVGKGFSNFTIFMAYQHLA